MTAARAIASLLVVVAATGCRHDERRRFQEAAPETAPSRASDRFGPRPEEDNPWAVSQGKLLYVRFNCVGCHAQGGGAIGPPLMDGEWRYGARPEDVFQSIVEGRPNGMPSFGGRIPTHQVWQLVAYVRSMSGQLPSHVAGGRTEGLGVRPPEAITPPERPHLVPREAETSRQDEERERRARAHEEEQR